jgi:hypothetical protein
MLIKAKDNTSLEKLSPRSKKDVWFICESCECGALIQYKNYLNQEEKLCRFCRNKKTANSDNVKNKQSRAAKNKWKDPKYREKTSQSLSKARKKAWDKVPKEKRVPANKKSYEEMCQEVQSHNLESYTSKEEWEKGNSGSFQVYCPQHPENIFKFRKGHGCKYCTEKKIDKFVYQKQCEEIGYQLIDVKNGWIYFICDQGHETQVSLNNWKKGSRCKYCTGYRLNSNEMIKAIENKGWNILYIPVDKKDLTSKIWIKIQCIKCGYEKYHRYIGFRNNYRCERCKRRKRNEKIKKKVEKEGYTFLNSLDEYIEKVYFICPRGHSHQIYYGNWQAGQRCKYCYLEDLKKQVKERLDQLDDQERYYELVDFYTKRSWVLYYEYVNPFDLPRGNEYHLDHMYSKIQGYKDGILPQIIGSPVNLQVINSTENIQKDRKCSIDKEKLFEEYDKFVKENE